MAFADSIAPIIAGLVFFALGLQTLRYAIEKLSGAYLKVALNLLAGNRFFAALVGSGSSFLLSSTAATTVLLVGMGDSGLLTLRQALPVILGAAFGTSLTVQIIAFNLGTWSIYVVAAGFLLRFVRKHEYLRITGHILFGLGIVFFGMALMKAGVRDGINSPGLLWAERFLSGVGANPFSLFLLGIAATAVLQSSAATLALVFAFGASAETAIPVAIGASIGTCAAGLVSGIAARPIGRQIALAHLIMKLIAASLFMMLLVPFTHSVLLWSLRLGLAGPADQARIIAHANTLYTFLSAIVLLPLIPALEQIVLSLAGRKQLAAPLSGFSLADLDEPGRAVSKAHAQTVKMGRTALSMLRGTLTAFLVDSRKVAWDIESSRERLDTSDIVLSDLLRRLDENRLSAGENRTRNRLLYVIRDIAYIGDVIARELVPLAQAKSKKGLDFPIEGAQQFERFHRLVAGDLSEILDLLEGLPASGDAVLAHAPAVDALRRNLAQAHVHRASQGVTADVETGRILLDAVAALRVIHYYVCDMVDLLREDHSHPARP